VIEPQSTVFNGDCMEFMSQFTDNYFELAIVDPPYGGDDAINLKDNIDKKKQATTRTQYKSFENIQPQAQYFKELKRVSRNQIIWGVNFYNTFDLSGGRLCWDKKGTAFGRAELAYLSMTKSVNICDVTWNGMIQCDMKNKESRIHPTQKPVSLYEWLLKNYAKDGDKILDTHMGSQSSRIASWKHGFDYWGSELDDDYFKSGCERFERESKQPMLLKV
jgi:site-specific DNA-methyltransferase (adenine-specific)